MTNFQSTYLLKHDVTLSGSEKVVKEYKKAYKKGRFHQANQDICDSIIKYGDAFQYLFFDANKVIQSKLIPPENAYPVYDDYGTYVGFVEHYTNVDGISYWYVYSPDTVEKYTDRGNNLQLVSSQKNLSGLPIHYKSQNEVNYLFGRSDLDDYIGILDNMEDLISKATDSYYRYITGIPVMKGQALKGEGLPTNTTVGGIVIDTDADFKFEFNNFDSKGFETLYKTLMQALMDVSGTPSVSMGHTSISNLSEVSIKLLFSLAEIKATMNERYIREGINVLHEQLRKMMVLQGITFADDDYDTLDVVFVYNRPSNEKDIIDNLKTLDDMGAISLQSILEQNPYINDVTQELARIKADKNSQPKNKDTLTVNNPMSGNNAGNNGNVQRDNLG